jgi:hypothetical protein
VHAATLLAVPFDIKEGELTGAPVPVIDGVMRSAALVTGAAQISY